MNTKTLIKQKLKEALEPKDIVITLPKSIKWSDYSKELDEVKDGSSVMNFKLNAFPNTAAGKKCYVVHNGAIRGWMEIVGLTEKDFICSTTGKKWKGKFVQRSGEFHFIDPIPMKGFQGFRYYN